jgi:hypothetical protein
MNKILELTKTYREPIEWAVLILNLIAGLSSLMIGNITQTIFHFSIVLIVVTDIADRKLSS